MSHMIKAHYTCKCNTYQLTQIWRLGSDYMIYNFLVIYDFIICQVEE